MVRLGFYPELLDAEMELKGLKNKSYLFFDFSSALKLISGLYTGLNAALKF